MRFFCQIQKKKKNCMKIWGGHAPRAPPRSANVNEIMNYIDSMMHKSKSCTK